MWHLSPAIVYSWPRLDTYYYPCINFFAKTLKSYDMWISRNEAYWRCIVARQAKELNGWAWCTSYIQRKQTSCTTFYFHFCATLQPYLSAARVHCQHQRYRRPNFHWRRVGKHGRWSLNYCNIKMVVAWMACSQQCTRRYEKL